MQAEPRIVERGEQPYVSIRGLVPMQAISSIADRIPEVIGWLGARGVEPAGAPFLRYDVIDMEGQLELEAGVPVAVTVEGDDQVRPGVLPAGRYATVTHLGHFSQLYDVTAALLDWATEQGLQWDMSEESDGSERWGCRLEAYQTNPAEEPNPDKWETELAFRLAD